MPVVGEPGYDRERRAGSGRSPASLALALTALLAACSLTPDYERPGAPVPGEFPGAGGATATAVPSWRSYFSDPTLQRLIETALAQNRDLRVALAQVEEARALAGLAGANRFPAVNAQGSGIRARTPADLSSTGEARVSSRYDANLAVPAFELDFWGRVGALHDAARARYLATEEATRSFRVSLIGAVAEAWFELSELDVRARLAHATLKSRARSLELVRQRRDAGIGNDLDVLAAESLAESVRAQWAELRRQRAQVENALQLLTGMSGTLPDPAAVPPAPAMTELAPGLPSDVLLRRPDVLAAEQRLIAANADIGAARAAFFPQISLTASFGTASAALNGLFGAGSRAWLFEPVLTLPLFDAGRNQLNLDIAEARKVAAVAEYERAIQQAFREVADALAAQTTYRDQLAAQDAYYRVQRERFEQVQARAQAGIASYLEVLDASRDVFAAEQVWLATQRQVLSAQVALFKALGGGE